MNRKILFRGKSINHLGWEFGYLIQSFGKWFIGNTVGNYQDDWCEVIPETVGQFTGLTDKNGVKIFEGDIRDFGTGVGYVIWDDVCFAIKSPGSEAVDHEHSSVFINSTLLGNIHDK